MTRNKNLAAVVSAAACVWPTQAATQTVSYTVSGNVKSYCTTDIPSAGMTLSASPTAGSSANGAATNVSAPTQWHWTVACSGGATLGVFPTAIRRQPLLSAAALGNGSQAINYKATVTGWSQTMSPTTDDDRFGVARNGQTSTDSRTKTAQGAANITVSAGTFTNAGNATGQNANIYATGTGVTWQGTIRLTLTPTP